MATEIKMPQLGETVVEGTITKWLKKEGDTIEADELLVEVSTDKVDSEVPSSASGVIQKILVPEGETVKVGTALAVIGEGGESGGDGQAAQDDQQEAKEDEAEQPQAQGEAQTAEESTDKPLDQQGQEAPEPGQEPESGQPAAREESEQKQDDAKRAQGNGQSQKAPPPPPKPGPTGAPGDQSKRGIISPLVRRLADENSVDLNEIEGTGTGGRIRKQDVLRFVEERKRTPAPSPAAASAGGQAEAAPQAEASPEEAAQQPSRAVGGREELVPWTNIRRRTAEHMVASSREVARAWNAVEADWTNVAKLRAKAKEAFKEREGFSLTYMPFLCKAVCDTLMEMPEVNATFDEENQANRVKHYVNLGIAVALEGGGLIVPVIKGADEKNLVGLARSVNDLATRARSKKLSPDDLTEGTFTITNPGPFGSVISVPIIPRGQTGILGFEAVRKAVVATEDDQIAIRSMGFLTMSWDHRTIDGAEAAKFLAALRERIETTDFTADLSPYL